MITSIRAALRRAWSIPLRGTLAIVLVAGAWFTLFAALTEVDSLRSAAKRATELDGVSVYRVSVKLSKKAETQLRSNNLPRRLLEQFHQQGKLKAILLARKQFVVSPDRSRVRAVSLILVDASLARQFAGAASFFPACASALPEKDWREPGQATLLQNRWRCSARDLPTEFKKMEADAFNSFLYLPMYAAAEVYGSQSLDEVQTAWLNINEADGLALLDFARLNYKVILELQPLGRLLEQQTMSLHSVSQSWLGAAMLLLLFGIGLYLHGVYAALRKEAGLRICLGHSWSQLTRWLIIDLLSQAMVLTLASGLLGAVAHQLLLGNFARLTLTLSLAVVLIGLLIFSLIALCLTLHWSRGKRVLLLLKENK